MGDDLFTAAAEERLLRRSPLAARLRPRHLDDVVGQPHLLAPGKPLRALIEADRLSSVILWGPPGTGKTSLARLIASTTEKVFVELSAVTASVKDVREEIAAARHRLGERGSGTILFLDEVHRFNKAQQDTLLPAVEEGLIVLIGATTENPHFEVNPPLMSRSTLFRLHPLDDTDVAELIGRGFEVEGATADPDAVEHLAQRAGGDGRHALTSAEVAVALAADRGRPLRCYERLPCWAENPLCCRPSPSAAPARCRAGRGRRVRAHRRERARRILSRRGQGPGCRDRDWRGSHPPRERGGAERVAPG